MRSAAPALLPVFRSRLQADILAALLLKPGEEHSLTELADRFGAPLSTVHGEVRRLTDAGLLQRRQAGRSVMVRANPDNRLTRPLAELLFLSWGPLQVVAEEFSGLEGAEEVLIFGSWAARYQERHGKPPNDVDVLVVGRPSREDVYDAADRAQQRLGMPVNPVIRTGEAWRQASDPLVRQIQSSPYVAVLVPDGTTAPAQNPEKGNPGDG
jgi:DNA-binding transcriptional ArsR family regulator